MPDSKTAAASESGPQFDKSLLHPKHWATWIGLGILVLLTRLPYRWQLAIGKRIGLILHKVARSRRHVRAEQHHTLPFSSRFANFFKTDKFSACGQPRRMAEPGDEGFHQADAVINKDLTHQCSLLVSGFLREVNA